MGEVFVLLALVVINGLFSGAEIAVLTAAKGHVEQRASLSDPRALAVVALRGQPERFLATVQIGITVIGAAAAAFGGASVAMDLVPLLEPLVGASAHQVAMVLVVALVSFLSLVLGELVPKSLALRYANGYAFAIARPLLSLARVMKPLVWFLTACSNLVLRLFGDKTTFVESRISRDELRQLVEEAAKAGSVDSRSSEIAARALDLADVTVGEVMVRRERIVAIARDAAPSEVQRRLLEEGHTRMPVYEGDIDSIIGYVTARDVLALAWEGALIRVDDIIRPIIVVPVTAGASRALRELQSHRLQIAVVVDEDGGTAGIVTIEDLCEELIGEIAGEHDASEETLKIDDDGSALVPGWLPIRQLNRAFHTNLPIARDHVTVAGLCMALALSVPAVGATLMATDGTVLEVVDASDRRVRMVRVRRPTRRNETTTTRNARGEPKIG